MKRLFNPFYPFTSDLLEAFVSQGYRYFVRQTFNRGFDYRDIGIKGYYQVCHYKELGKAQEHYGILKNDPARYIYDWQKEEDQRKLKIAAGDPPGYKLFSLTVVPNWKGLITKQLEFKFRNYIESKLHWKPSRKDTVEPSIFTMYGELFVMLKFGSQEARVKFAEIEGE